MIDPRVEPNAFTKHADGTVEVTVHQTVRDLKGSILSDKMVRHIFRMQQGLIRRFDIG
jgi:hypothetical protein